MIGTNAARPVSCTARDISECFPDRPPLRGVLRVRTEPNVVRVELPDDVCPWMLILPDGGPQFDMMKFQARTIDANSSAVVELKMDGQTYRRHLSVLRHAGDANSQETAWDTVVALLEPLIDLTAAICDHSVAGTSTREDSSRQRAAARHSFLDLPLSSRPGGTLRLVQGMPSVLSD